MKSVLLASPEVDTQPRRVQNWIDCGRSNSSFASRATIYWSTQTGILVNEVMAWSAQANSEASEAAALLRASADREDGIEKLPVTPGPILPTREQLGDLLLQQNQPAPALKEFRTSLISAPGRLGASEGVAHASEISSQISSHRWRWRRPSMDRTVSTTPEIVTEHEDMRAIRSISAGTNHQAVRVRLTSASELAVIRSAQSDGRE
jgi:hypothetical protein